MSTTIIAIILGALFGSSLVLSGLTDPDKIIGALRLRDFHALRTVVVFVLVGMLGTWILGLEGAANLNVRPAAILTILIGGALLGAGLGLTGFGPATGLASAASGRIDALATVIGMFIGAHAYVLSYPSLAMRLEKLLNFGRVTLPQITGATAASWVIPIFATGSVMLLLTLPRKPREAKARRKARDWRMDGVSYSAESLLNVRAAAAKVFRKWTNCLSLTVVLCIFLLQTSFWLVRTGYIQIDHGIIADTSVILDNNKLTDQATRPAVTEPGQSAGATVVTPVKMPRQEDPFLFGISFHRLTLVVGTGNALLVFASALYCLIIFCGLTISLDGSLGHLKHICRAFYLSVVVLFLLLPWQIPFGPIAFGATYTPRELVGACTADTSGILDMTLLNLRFAGWGALAVLVLAVAQWHSLRWASFVLDKDGRVAQGQPVSEGKITSAFAATLRIVHVVVIAAAVTIGFGIGEIRFAQAATQAKVVAKPEKPAEESVIEVVAADPDTISETPAESQDSPSPQEEPERDGPTLQELRTQATGMFVQ
jgi:hypothetical protein